MTAYIIHAYIHTHICTFHNDFLCKETKQKYFSGSSGNSVSSRSSKGSGNGNGSQNKKATTSESDSSDNSNSNSSSDNSDSSNGDSRFLYCLNLVFNQKDNTVKRGAIVKAMAVASPYPFIHILKVCMYVCFILLLYLHLW